MTFRQYSKESMDSLAEKRGRIKREQELAKRRALMAGYVPGKVGPREGVKAVGAIGHDKLVGYGDGEIIGRVRKSTPRPDDADPQIGAFPPDAPAVGGAGGSVHEEGASNTRVSRDDGESHGTDAQYLIDRLYGKGSDSSADEAGSGVDVAAQGVRGGRKGSTKAAGRGGRKTK